MESPEGLLSVNCICGQCGQTWDAFSCGMNHGYVKYRLRNGTAVIECKHEPLNPPDDHNPMAEFKKAITAQMVMTSNSAMWAKEDAKNRKQRARAETIERAARALLDAFQAVDGTTDSKDVQTQVDALKAALAIQ